MSNQKKRNGNNKQKYSLDVNKIIYAGAIIFINTALLFFMTKCNDSLSAPDSIKQLKIEYKSDIKELNTNIMADLKIIKNDVNNINYKLKDNSDSVSRLDKAVSKLDYIVSIMDKKKIAEY